MKPLKYTCSSCGKKMAYRGYCPTCQTAYRQRNLLIGEMIVFGIGYMPSGDIPRDDYNDFVGAKWSGYQLKSDLHAGVLPPGLLLRFGNTTMVVHGGYDTHQWVMPYSGSVRVTREGRS